MQPQNNLYTGTELPQTRERIERWIMPVGSKDLNSGEYFYKTAVKTWTPLKVKLDFGQKIVWLIFGLFFKGCGLLFCSRSGHTDVVKLEKNRRIQIEMIKIKPDSKIVERRTLELK
jgi:hypothetical protein